MGRFAHIGAGLALTVLAIAPVSRSLADDAECKPLFDAMTRLFNTPSHQFLTQSNSMTGNKVVASEIINTGKAMYIMVDGKWHNSEVSSAQLQQQEEQNRKSAKLTTCRLVDEEALDGTKVKLFSAHTETQYGISDQQMWIGKSSGLPLRETIDMDMGEHGGKSRAEIHVVYEGIETPPVAPPAGTTP